MNNALSCACGTVTGSATPSSDISGACHCVTCRKWSGGAYIAVSCSDVSFDDMDAINIWHSSDWGQRVSCKTCGSALVWQMRDGSHHSVSIQAFDDPARFPLASEIFTDEKPAGFDFAGTHERLTRAETMAKYAPKPEAH